VVGTSGSGRSTLAFLLAKLHAYTGSVQLDGQELAQIENAAIGRQVGYVGADGRLFTSSVFENVIYGLRLRERDGLSPPAGGGEPAVEFFDRARFAHYASIGENVLFGYSRVPELALDRLADHPHFQRVAAEVELEGPLLALGAGVAKDMVEIFKDIRPGD